MEKVLVCWMTLGPSLVKRQLPRCALCIIVLGGSGSLRCLQPNQNPNGFQVKLLICGFGPKTTQDTGPTRSQPPLPTCPQSRGSSLDRTPSGPLADSTQPPGPLPSLLITTGADTFDRKPPRVAAVMCSGITVNHPTVPRSTPFGSKQYGKMAPSEPFAPVSTFQPCRLPAMSWSQL